MQYKHASIYSIVVKSVQIVGLVQAMVSIKHGMILFCVFVPSEKINTKISTEYTELDFPAVTFCNLNPFSYKRAKKVPMFYQIINATANALKQDISYLDYDDQVNAKTII